LVSSALLLAVLRACALTARSPPVDSPTAGYTPVGHRKILAPSGAEVDEGLTVKG
jgi:hypothetical protein